LKTGRFQLEADRGKLSEVGGRLDEARFHLSELLSQSAAARGRFAGGGGESVAALHPVQARSPRFPTRSGVDL
jgi:hypothetical protein